MSNNKVEDLMGWLALLITVPLMLIVAGLARSFVLVKLWAWYIVPVFHLPMLSMVQAYGLFLVYAVFVGTEETEQTETKKGRDALDIIVNAIAKVAVAPFITLFIAWIVKILFM